jgi:CheY-like chemotaxis protein
VPAGTSCCPLFQPRLCARKHNRRVKDGCVTDGDFRKLVKEALEHLYDTAYLATHPLVEKLATTGHINHMTRAQKLRGTLKEAIEALRPQADVPASASEWRSYLALRYRYAQGMSLAQVEGELGLSLRQVQRELHKGIDAVTAVLWEMRATKLEAADRAAGEPGEVQALRDEMHQWRVLREACAVRALLDEATWMLEPLFSQAAMQLRVELPHALSPVLIDVTLTRQALFQILRLVLQQAQDSEVVVQVRAQGDQVELRVRCPACHLDPQAPDWQMAQLLFEQQSGALADDAEAAAGTGLVIRLPRAHPYRVLIVDDNPATHQLLERYLAPHFYEVAHASSGADALQQVSEAAPDIIILDVMMPSMDGWQVLRALTESAQTAGIPVVVCSVLKEPELAVSLGARVYLKKPVDRLELLATLANLRGPAPLGAAGPPAVP